MMQRTSSSLALLAATSALALSACGGSQEPAVAAASEVTSTQSNVEPAAPAVDPAAELQAREKELAAREAEVELKAREADLARREAELAARQGAVKTSTPAKAAATTPRPAASTASAPPKTATQPAPVAAPINVPAGTPLSVELTAGVSTKKAKVGDRVQGRLASDVVTDGRVAARAGTVVLGTVTEVVSGSARIGGVPTLALAFDTLTLPSGVNVPISGRFLQQEKSDAGEDTAKILGGTAAGAVIGHQVDDDKGKIIGGVLGGAAGAIAAQKTGGDIRLPAGTVLSVALDAPFEVSSS